MATGLDALIAELLGDVGKLHDEIKELPSSLEGITSDYLARLERASGLIDDRANHLRQIVTQSTNEHVDKLEAVLSSEINKITHLMGQLDGKRNDIANATGKLERAYSGLQDLQEKMLSDTASNVAELVSAYTASKKEAELLDLKRSINEILDVAIKDRIDLAFGDSISACSEKVERLGIEAEGFSEKIKSNYSDVSGFLGRGATVALCLFCSIISAVLVEALRLL